ncbi:PaaI family thioesterase [Maricaulis parjimensis]|uniref:PaaI family thioesterase n=1 Tax=Maricaulis parjimensis TaxID=144023 RepID=UPI001939DF2C|nr:PaaI family thioesterase [Maricaulis parjimensis]
MDPEPPEDPEEFQKRLDALAPLIVDGAPYAVSLGFKIIEMTQRRAVMTTPYSEDLIGDPETGTLHGGVITALLDHCCGMAAFGGLGARHTPATLDLRIDYMRPAKPGCDITAEAHCLKSHGLVAFVRATAHDGDPEDPVAIAQAAFMISGASKAAHKRAMDAIRGGGE